MEFTSVLNLNKRKSADALVIPFWKGESHPTLTVKEDFPVGLISRAIELGDFKGNESEIVTVYPEDQPEKRFILLGLGSREKASGESFRCSYGTLTKYCISRKWKSLNVLVPKTDHLSEKEVVEVLAEGLLLPNYRFERHKSCDPENEESSLLQKISWIGISARSDGIAEKVAAICNGVYYTRDLVNGNADEVNAQYLALCARGLSKEFPKIKTTIFDKKRIEKEGMGLLLAVNRGCTHEPAFIIMEYKGNPKSDDHTVLIGKGITYDTGGLNLKPTGGMETMKCDMAGGAACFGTLLAVSELDMKVNLTVVIPATENSIDANSFKPGDVYPSYAGIMVEMTNTDAEGRLVLADALAYTVSKLNPTRIIDLATLTGAIEVSLGSEASGIMSNDDTLSLELMSAGEKTYERLWRMPLYPEYRDRLKSDIGDIKSWNGRSASSCVAATFLLEFVKDAVPWAHLDIAGTAFVTEMKKYHPKYATGVGVRLIVEFLDRLQKKS